MKHEKKQEEYIESLEKKLTENKDPYPLIVEVHPTDKCGHRCKGCFHDGRGYDFSKDDKLLTIDEYALIFYELRSLGINNVSISGGGDPLEDKRTPELINMVHDLGLKARIVTNGSQMRTPEVITALLNSEEVRISIDAAGSRTYANLRRISEKNYNLMIENLKKLIKEKEKRESDLKIGVTFRLGRENYVETETFCKEMLLMGVDSIVIKQDVYAKRLLPEKIIDEVYDSVLMLENPKIEFRKERMGLINGMHCFIPYIKVAFNPYGDLHSCCLGAQPNEKNGFFLGNIKGKTFVELWMNSKEVRMNMMKKGVGCTTCNYTDYKINKAMGG